jgi:hypothetical protein
MRKFLFLHHHPRRRSNAKSFVRSRNALQWLVVQHAFPTSTLTPHLPGLPICPHHKPAPPPNNSPLSTSQLPQQQIPNHLPSRNPRSSPQSRKIEGTRKRIRVPKPKHRRDPTPGVLQRKTGFTHGILLHLSPFEMMNRTCGIHLRGIRAGRVSVLGPVQNVKVVVCSMAAGVALGADGRAEDDEVFCYACFLMLGRRGRVAGGGLGLLREGFFLGWEGEERRG